jgi:hypothetical protein
LPQDVSAEGVGFGGQTVAGFFAPRAAAPEVRRGYLPDWAEVCELRSPISDRGPAEDHLQPPRRWFGGESAERRIERSSGVEGEARVLQLLGDVLLLEFEILYDGMELPPGGARVTAQSHAGPILRATVVEERSSYRHAYPAGLTVQLALRAAGWESFLAHGLFHVTMEAGGRAIFLSVKQLL